MKFIVGEKQNMTQVFDEIGNAHSATLLSCNPVTVTQIKTTDVDGYEAVQVGYGIKNAKNINKAQKGHVKELGNFAGFVECVGMKDSKVGDKFELGLFKAGDMVTVSSISKGKGFQGGVKRHGFSGGRRSHGNKHSEREPGSIGGGLRTRVPKGMRMAGRMGGERITVKNLSVLKVDAEKGELFIEGAIPGHRGTVVEIRATK